MLRKFLHAAALVALLLCLCAGAHAQTPYTDLTAACQDVRAAVHGFAAELSFSLTKEAVNGGHQSEIRDILTDVLEGYIDYTIRFEMQGSDLHVGITGSMRPALRLLRAWETGDRSALTADEERTLDMALAIAKECRSGAKNALEIERAVYDAVCHDVDYSSLDPLPAFGTDEYARVNSCVGALLDGETTCLGYSEAFYLISRLAGLDVEMQYGFPGGASSGKHAWNTVRVGEKVYTVDACWGDGYGEIFELTAPDYRCFNTGIDLMPENRHAHPEAAVALISQETDWAHTAFGAAGGGIVCKSLDEAIDYAILRHNEGQSCAHIFIPGEEIALPAIDAATYDRTRAEGITTVWGRMNYAFAGGTYIIYRWVHE